MINDFVCMTSNPALFEVFSSSFSYSCYDSALVRYTALLADGAEEGATGPSRVFPTASNDLLSTLIKMLTNTRDPSCLKRISLSLFVFFLLVVSTSARHRVLFWVWEFTLAWPTIPSPPCGSQQDVMTNFPPFKTFHLPRTHPLVFMCVHRPPKTSNIYTVLLLYLWIFWNFTEFFHVIPE